MPDKMKVDDQNQSQIPQEVEVKNFPEQQPIPATFEIKQPQWWYQISLNDLGRAIDPLKELVRQGGELNLDKYQHPREALAVRLVSKNGRDFYEAIMAVVSGGGGGFPFETGGKKPKAALVDGECHLQV